MAARLCMAMFAFLSVHRMAAAADGNPLRGLPDADVLSVLCAGSADYAARVSAGVGMIRSEYEVDSVRWSSRAAAGKAVIEADEPNALGGSSPEQLLGQMLDRENVEIFVAWDAQNVRNDHPRYRRFIDQPDRCIAAPQQASQPAIYTFGPRRPGIDPFKVDPRRWGFSWEGHSLRALANNLEFRGIRFEAVDGVELPVIEFRTVSSSRVLVTVDNLHGYILRRVEAYRPATARHPVSIEENYPRAFGDAWSVGKRVLTRHVPTSVDADVPELDFRRTWTLADGFQVNAPLPEGVFSLAGLGAKRGDEVWDMRSSPPQYMIYGEPPLDEAALRRKLSGALALAKQRRAP